MNRRRTCRCPLCGCVRRRRPARKWVYYYGWSRVPIRVPVVGRRTRVQSYGPCPTRYGRPLADGEIGVGEWDCGGTLLLPRDSAFVLRAMRARERRGWQGGGTASEHDA